MSVLAWPSLSAFWVLSDMLAYVFINSWSQAYSEEYKEYFNDPLPDLEQMWCHSFCITYFYVS